MKKIVLLFTITLLVFITACDPSIFDSGKLLPDFTEVEKPSGDNSYDVTAKPELVKATDSVSPTTITVSWKAVKGALSYSIERKTADSSWLTIATVNSTSTSYVDNSRNTLTKYPISVGVDYTYRVRAVFPTGETGEYSAEVTGRLLSSPTQLSATKGDNTVDGIKVTWNHVKGISTYQVWMMPNDDSYKMAKIVEVKAALSDADCEYTYPISVNINSDKIGKEYRFTVIAVTASGVTSGDPDDAAYTVGYSFNQDAPGKVTNVSASFGESSEGITITWDDQPDVASDYIIYRAENGGTESKIYKIRSSQKLTYNSDGTVSYLDNDSLLSDNKLYTYSVVATATKTDESGATVTLMGPAETTTGYLLSAPDGVHIESLTYDAAAGYGFTLRFNAPIGLDNDADLAANSNWKFSVYGWNSTDHPSISGTNYSDAVSLTQRKTLYNKIKDVSPDPVTTVEASSLVDGSALVSVYYGDQKYDSFAVVTINAAGKESLFSVVDAEWIGPEQPAGSFVSNTYYSDYSANSNGVYPVRMNFSFKDYRGIYYVKSLKIVNSDTGNTLYETNLASAADAQSVGGFFNDSAAVPGQKLNLTLSATDIFDHTSTYTYDNAAYGGLTPEKFVAFFESAVLKPWSEQNYIPSEYKSYWSSSAIGTMVEKGNSSSLSTQMGALGSASDKDHFRGGTVDYNASTEGIGGQIYFTYTNFGESEAMWSTGAYEMHVDSGGTGSAASKTNGFNIYGWYPGTLGLSGISVSGKAFTGSYNITIQYSNMSWSGSVGANQK